MARTVKIVTNTPTNSPAAVPYADIKGQGRIPYGTAKDVAVPEKMKKMTARGMGAAVKGGGYMGYS